MLHASPLRGQRVKLSICTYIKHISSLVCLVIVMGLPFNHHLAFNFLARRILAFIAGASGEESGPSSSGSFSLVVEIKYLRKLSPELWV